MIISPSGRVPGRASEPSRTRVDNGGGYRTFRGWMLGYLGFSRGRQFIGGRAILVDICGPPPRGGAAKGGRAALWCDCFPGPLRVCFGLRVRVSNIGISAFVSSNFENISRTTFLKYKNNRKQEQTLWHLVNRLVLENA